MDTSKQNSDITMTETYEDLIQRCRENGLRDIADAVEMLMDVENVFAVDRSELPIEDGKSVPFRAGVVWGVEYVCSQNGNENPEKRRKFCRVLRKNGDRRVADAFEYCWANSDEVVHGDFDSTVLPLHGARLFAFAVGQSFGITRKRREKDK